MGEESASSGSALLEDGGGQEVKGEGAVGGSMCESDAVGLETWKLWTGLVHFEVGVGDGAAW